MIKIDRAESSNGRGPEEWNLNGLDPDFLGFKAGGKILGSATSEVEDVTLTLEKSSRN